MIHQRSQIGLPSKNMNTCLENMLGRRHVCYMLVLSFQYSSFSIVRMDSPIHNVKLASEAVRYLGGKRHGQSIE